MVKKSGQNLRSTTVCSSPTVILILIVVAALLLTGCSGSKGDLTALEGTWRYAEHTEYEFDGKGGGCMCIDEKDHYEFTYDITGDAVSIDFKSDNVVDCQYTFSVDSDKLTLTGGEGTAQPGAVYELTKE